MNKTHQVKPLPFKELKGISQKTNEIHHGKLYTGYVNKRNEIEEKIEKVDKSASAASFSEYRSLKAEETFNANGQILHEIYFDELGGDGNSKGEIVKQIESDFGSFENWLEDFKAAAMAARGWVILAYDTSDGRLHNFIGDAHNQGGVWGAIPLFNIDVYEHAYFIDFGSDRRAYIEAFLDNVDWNKINQRFLNTKK